MSQTNRHLKLDLLAARYLDALEREDFTTMGTIWHAALKDPELHNVLNEVHIGLLEEQKLKKQAQPSKVHTGLIETETQDKSEGSLVIIDDIPENLTLLTILLSNHGYKTRTASTGAMGLETIGAEPPDLVLLDLMLPDLDGYEVCRRLKQDSACANVPVIFLTNRNETDAIVRAFEAGAVDYVITPFHCEELLARIATHIRLRRAEKERSRIERRLYESQRLESLGEVAGGISHQLNNLLTPILGYVELARTNLPADSPQVNYLLEIVERTQGAADLCRQMLAYSGRSFSHAEKIDLNEIIKEFVAFLRRALPTRAVLRLDLCPDLPPVLIDPTQIRQVLANLVRNAGEALINATGTVTLSTSMCQANKEMLTASDLSFDLPAGEYVCLEVIDDGCGISEQTRSRIFDPFFSTKVYGTGLGLAAVQGIIRMHKGTIQVESQVNKGSCFRILLPSAPPLAPTDRPNQVLIVDDDHSVRQVVSMMLEQKGYATVAVASGQDALEYLQQFSASVSLILLDLTMPRMDGVETFRRIQEITKTIPVVLMSGYYKEQVLAKFKHGSVGFLRKPFSQQQLVTMVETALRNNE